MVKRQIIQTTVLAGIIAMGFTAGRITTPTKIVTVQESRDFESVYYDVPLSHDLQRHIREICKDEGVPESLVLAIIEQGSQFNQEAVSPADDYGLMQINEVNTDWLSDELHAPDMLNPYQNVYAGVKIIAKYLREYEDYSKALMCYNLGEYGAKKVWDEGITTTPYCTSVLALMDTFEKEGAR